AKYNKIYEINAKQGLELSRLQFVSCQLDASRGPAAGRSIATSSPSWTPSSTAICRLSLIPSLTSRGTNWSPDLTRTNHFPPFDSTASRGTSSDFSLWLTTT